MISDLRMPNKGGIEIFRHCVDRKPALTDRFLFLTGDVVCSESRKQLEESEAPFLEKPFGIDDVALARLLDPISGD